MNWLKWWHGTATDPKLRWVSVRAGVTLSEVIAVWVCCLEHANTCDTRGSIAGLDAEAIDVHLGATEGTTAKILAAFEAKGLTDPDGTIRKWDDRQSSDGDYSTDRVRKHRSAKRSETVGNGVKRNVTPGNVRGEEIRGEERREEKDNPPSPPTGGRDGRRLNIPASWDGWVLQLHDLCDLHPFEWVQRAIDDCAGQQIANVPRYLARVLVGWKAAGGPPAPPKVHAASKAASEPEPWSAEEQREYYAARYAELEAEEARKVGA